MVMLSAPRRFDMNPDPSVQELDTMRYSELQRLAKAHGLKANLKAGVLLKKLKGHFHPDTVIGNSSTDSDANDDDDKEQSANAEDKVLASVSFVTLRRGRRQKYISPKAETGSPGKMNKDKTGSGNKRKCRVANEASIQVPDEPKKNTESCAPGCKIPRYAARLPKPNTKPSTPNFKMLHDAHFKKMESIDKYMERKQKRLDAVSSSIREVKMLAKTSNLLEGSEKTPSSSSKKPIKGRLSLMSPAPQKISISSSKTPASQRRSRRSDLVGKSILLEKSGFQPSVFTVSKMNVRFSMATKDNEYKHSLAKTPARKSAGFGNVTPETLLQNLCLQPGKVLRITNSFQILIQTKHH
uniref:Nucleolar and spindle associated protein 1 n=1 Tax=Leptobrachium leishanense TaxID=445787 RepID=A0A8C5R6F6_9ANUR